MAGITFNLELNNKANKDGTYTVYLRITQEKKHKRVKTIVDVKRKTDFNKKAKQGNWIRTSDPDHKKKNDDLDRELKRVKDAYLDLREEGMATKDKIVSTLVAKEKQYSFVQYAKQRTQEIYDAGGIRNWKKYNGFCNKLEGFLTDKKGVVHDLTFTELTQDLLSKFEVYMHSLFNERESNKKLHPNTIRVNFNIFRTLVRRAIDTHGLLKPEKNPFLSYSYKGVKTTKEKLDETEINVIKDLELQKDSLLWHTRNYFMFSFYCAGIRAGDLIQLRWCNITSDGRINYQMGKNHKVRDLILVRQARDILSLYYKPDAKHTDYIFPLLDSSAVYAKAVTQADKDTLPTELKIKLFNQISAKNALLNKYLKKLADLASIEKKLSFHTSRHSFAKAAKTKGTDNAKLKDLLAHSSLSVTEGYMGDFDTFENDKALETIFEKDNSPKAELISMLDKLDPEKIQEIINSLKGNI